MSDIINMHHNGNHRKITVKWPKDELGRPIEINLWVQTLPQEEQDLWQEVHLEHEKMVADAMAAGDAWKEFTKDGPIINWKSTEIHDRWCDTIPQNRNTIYLEFWQKFRSAFSD